MPSSENRTAELGRYWRHGSGDIAEAVQYNRIAAAQKVAVESSDATDALHRTRAWWHAYWDRAYVVTDAGGGTTIFLPAAGRKEFHPGPCLQVEYAVEQGDLRDERNQSLPTYGGRNVQPLPMAAAGRASNGRLIAGPARPDKPPARMRLAHWQLVHAASRMVLNGNAFAFPPRSFLSNGLRAVPTKSRSTMKPLLTKATTSSIRSVAAAAGALSAGLAGKPN